LSAVFSRSRKERIVFAFGEDIVSGVGCDQ